MFLEHEVTSISEEAKRTKLPKVLNVFMVYIIYCRVKIPSNTNGQNDNGQLLPKHNKDVITTKNYTNF